MAEIQVRRFSVIADASGDQLLLMDALPFKEVICWSLITARDVVAKCTRIDLVLMHSRVEFILRSRAVASKENTVTMLGCVHATGEYRVGARFIGATEGDELELYAYGVIDSHTPRP